MHLSLALLAFFFVLATPPEGITLEDPITEGTVTIDSNIRLTLSTEAGVLLVAHPLPGSILHFDGAYDQDNEPGLTRLKGELTVIIEYEGKELLQLAMEEATLVLEKIDVSER